MVDVLCRCRGRRRQSKTRVSLMVPEPSSLRDFSLSSNNLDSNDESLSDLLSESRPAERKTTFRPPILLRSSPNLVAAARAAHQEMNSKYRNFNDLWVRIGNEDNSHFRYFFFFEFVVLQSILPVAEYWTDLLLCCRSSHSTGGSASKMKDSTNAWYGIRSSRGCSPSFSSWAMAVTLVTAFVGRSQLSLSVGLTSL